MSIYRHRSRPACPAQVVQSEDAETQTEETANDSSCDLTMQLGGSAEESGNNLQPGYDVPSLPSTKSEVKAVSVEAHDIRDTMISNSLSFNTSHPKVEPSVAVAARMPIPTGQRFEPHSTIQSTFPQQAQLQNSARALKEEFQQGMDDVCQKLNNFFGKPHSLSGSSTSNKPIGFTHVKTPDRSSFSLFNTK